MRASRNLCFALIALNLTGCGGNTTPAGNDAQVPAANSETLNMVVIDPAAPVSISAGDRARICRAAIAGLNGHTPDIVKLVSSNDAEVRVKYARPSGGKIWTNECRFDGDRVVWRTVDAFGPGSGLGRWRDGPEDETITYKIEGKRISLKTAYSDGSGGTETYTIP